jgi:hypothetical protein
MAPSSSSGPRPPREEAADSHGFTCSCTADRLPGRSGGVCVQSVIENVHGLHGKNFILHICGGLSVR